MILAIDMGNSNVKIGIVDDDCHVIEERVHTDSTHTSLEYAEHFLQVLEIYGIKKEQITGAIIASVVPPLTAVLSAAVNKVFGFRPMIANGRLNTKVTFNGTDDPGYVGADLVAGAEAVCHEYPLPCITVCMGTATTIMVVDKTGDFRGGVILPGMKTSLSALSDDAAILPEISLDEPGSPITLNTVECMRSGIIYGNAAQIDGIVERMEKELGEKCTVVATGGMARFCVPYCTHDVILDRDLLMKGLYYIWRENRTEK